MVKLRKGDPWMPASKYGQSLKGLTINLLVNSIERALGFQTKVLETTVVYADPDVAVLRGYGSEWMMHADHTYSEHPLKKNLGKKPARGIGIELRLHGCNPDVAQAKALALGEVVLAEAADKAHGVREAYIIDPDGYTWVPDIPLAEVV
ncbi:MAG: hypothetical protein CFH06_00173 [Alphaproteobacteria bacterium MarineAlpha3_Bin5]|nr:hypothetical protein [Magnetovibrio sp.]PPR80010.1 MAG: hypothetical protein CFH06_00173 [Alphaproteobacteria bacterium MarineAlpha3_Bin5]